MKKVRGLFPLFDLVLGTKKGEGEVMAGGERENRKQRGAVANHIL